MGFTHYWTRKRIISAEEWSVIVEDVHVILSFIENEQGIPLANGRGEGGTRPVFGEGEFCFNGLGDDSHATMAITRDEVDCYCKTERKPYDLAVTAVLAYLSTVAETHDVSSDGCGADFLAGVEAVSRGLPKYGDIVDIPRQVMESDRWVGPWITNQSKSYTMHFCINGKAYIIREKDGLAYVFGSHQEAARWAAPHEAELLCPFGWFDKARWTRISRVQTKLFKAKFEHGEMFQPERISRPPLFVRPGEFSELPHFSSSLGDVLKLAD